MVYPDPKFWNLKLKNGLIYFSEDVGWFLDPMLLCKTFATNALKYKFMQDVWFGCDCVCSNIEHLSNIDEIGPSVMYKIIS